MKQIPYFILFSFCSIFVGNVFTQTATKQPVIWMYGHNGEFNSSGVNQWTNFVNSANQIVAQRQAHSFYNKFPQKTEEQGISGMANLVKNQFSFIQNPIYIGHSMGGLVGKKLDAEKEMKFKAIITMGSPLQGAKAANSILPKVRFRISTFGFSSKSDAYFFSQDAIWQLTRGMYSLFPLSYAVAGLQYFFDIFKVENALNTIFGSPSSKAVQELQIGSPHNYKQTTTPKINIYGEIKQPVLQSLANENGYGNAYNTCLDGYYTAFLYTRWVPLLNMWQAQECLASYLYLDKIVHGKYTQLISNDVKWESAKYGYWGLTNVRNCAEEVFRSTEQTCGRKWWSFICSFFVRIWRAVVCVVKTVVQYNDYYYEAPTYGSTDGLVSKQSATGEGMDWKGFPFKADNDGQGTGVSHMGLLNYNIMEAYYEEIFGARPGKNNLPYREMNSPFYIARK